MKFFEDTDYLPIYEEGITYWNQWRKENPEHYIELAETSIQAYDFSGADLSKIDFYHGHAAAAKFKNADLSNSEFTGATFFAANFQGANLEDADVSHANLQYADFTDANLRGDCFHGAYLGNVNFSGADLSNCNLEMSSFNETNIENSTIINCKIFGISVWELHGFPKKLSDLIITRENESTITVDSLQIPQFLYLLLNNKNLRDIINTTSSKVVLILGRFSPERKKILYSVKERLRQLNYIPIMFDFDKPVDRNLTETVTLIAKLSHFVIADLTEPSSIPQELQAIIPDNPSLIIQPIFEKKNQERYYSMFDDFLKSYSHCVLPIFEYSDESNLLSLTNKIVQSIEDVYSAKQR